MRAVAGDGALELQWTATGGQTQRYAVRRVQGAQVVQTVAEMPAQGDVEGVMYRLSVPHEHGVTYWVEGLGQGDEVVAHGTVQLQRPQ